MEQAAANDPLIGAQVGNYEVKRKLGEGGMGAVYLAEHPLIGKKVALKVLHNEFSSNQDVVSRFFTEAKAVNDIQHPNIVDIIDYGVIPQPDSGGSDMVYFIMEFLAGRGLNDLIRDEAPLAPERALAICIQIADALAASHRSNIVHRDLKPDNVILITRGKQSDFAKVLDFGIAKLTGDQPGSRRTRTGIVMGTPAYMSPEQCEGRGEVDHRTDVYALGILLYEMLTGRVPFLGEGYGEVLVQHLTQPPQKPSTIRGVIPPHVEAVCLKALEKRPEMRYQTMDDFMQALADPVGFVEARGGIQNFTSADLGAPSATPYPQPRPTLPMGGGPGGPSGPSGPPPAYHTPGPAQLTPPPGYLQPPQTGPTSWPTPPPPGPAAGRSRAGLFAAGGILVVALGVGGFFGIRALASGDGAEPVAEETVATTDGDETTEPDDGTETGPGTDTETADTTDTAETPPEPPPEPPPPDMVEIRITSKAVKATVFVGDATESAGTTPLDLSLPRGTDKVTVRLEAPNHKPRVHEFVPDSRKEFELLLEAEERRRPETTRPPVRPPREPKPDKKKPPVGDNVLPLDFR